MREALQAYGAEKSEFERLRRQQNEMLADWRRRGIGVDTSNLMSRDKMYDRAKAREDRLDAYR